MARLFQYPPIAEPVFVPVPPQEEIFLDKWFQPFSEPVRPIVFATALLLTSTVFSVLPIVPVDALTLIQTEPDKITTLLYQSRAEPVFVPVEEAEVELDKWFQPLSLPPRPLPALEVAMQQSLAIAEDTLALPENITLDKYFQPLSEPVRRVAFTDAVLATSLAIPETALALPADIKVSSWTQPLSLPVPSKAALPTALQQSLAIDPTALGLPEDVKVASYVPPLSEPVPAKARLATASQQSLALDELTLGLPENITVDKYFVALSEPVRLVPHAQPESWFYAAEPSVWPAEEPPLDSWYSPLSEPVRAGVPPLQQSLALPEDALGQPEEPTLSKWWLPLSEPVLPIAYHETAGETHVIEPSLFVSETFFPDKWFQPWSEPLQFKPRLITAQQQSLALDKLTLALPENITLDKYYQQLSRGRVRDYSGAYLLNPFFFDPEPRIDEEETSVDKWFQPWSEPTRPLGIVVALIPSLVLDEVTLGLPITVNLDQYFVSWSEPVRSLPPLPEAGQQSLAFVEFPAIVRMDSWFRSLSEPVRVGPTPFASVFVSGSTLNAELPEETALGKWFVPLSEPQWSLPPLSVALRSAVSDDLTLFALPENITLDKWFQPLGIPLFPVPRWLAPLINSSLFQLNISPFTVRSRITIQADVDRSCVSSAGSRTITPPHR